MTEGSFWIVYKVVFTNFSDIVFKGLSEISEMIHVVYAQ